MEKGIYVSTDKSVLNVNFIHDFVSNSYWGKGRTRVETIKTIENSLCFGLYTQNNVQIGFGRIVTDCVFFGYIMDVIIEKSHQGKGLGKILIEHMLKNEIVNKLKTVSLKTKDAHALYEKYGFKRIGDSALWMSCDKQKLE